MSQKLGSGFGLASTRSFGGIDLRNPEREGFKYTGRARKVLYNYLDQHYEPRVDGQGSEAVVYFPAESIEELVCRAPLVEEKRSSLRLKVREIAQNSLLRGYIPRERFACALEKTECLGEIAKYCQRRTGKWANSTFQKDGQYLVE